MSNFSSIGVSAYEITRDNRVTCPFRLAGRFRVHTGPMHQTAGEREPGSGLPPEMTAALTAFERHLRAERSLSPHTVRAYLGDVGSLLEHAAGEGVQTPAGLELTHLRAWLASQHASGAARTTLARRGAAARAFTAFAHRRGWLATDPGLRLGTLKARRALPHVLHQDEMRAVLDTAARHAETAGSGQAPGSGQAAQRAVALRDAAILELLYATGIRVSELCGLTPDSFDHGRQTVRVVGKGDKERTVPVGQPALRAVTRWLDGGPSRPGRPRQRASAVPRCPRRAAGPAHGPPDCARALARRRSGPADRPARPASQRGHSPARRWR